MSKKIKVLFVCLGNICRSPMAEGIFKSKMKEWELEDLFEADSCGTSDYHIGDLPDPRTIENAKQHQVILDHRARQLKKKDLEEFDHIFVMDDSNLQNTLKLDPSGEYEHKVEKLREYDPEAPGTDVPDPYFGGTEGFEKVYTIIDRSLEEWLKKHQ